MTKTIYCTIAAASALPEVLVLRDSLRAQGVEELRVLITEHPAVVAKLRAELPEFTLLSPSQVGCDKWLQLAFAGDATQLGAALKPALISTLLCEGNVIYFAPTIEVFAPLDGIEEALAKADLVVTPYISRPLPNDGKTPSMQDIFRAGPFNLDFVAVRQTKASAELMNWWKQLTAEVEPMTSDAVAPPRDQFWATAFASLSDRLHVLRSPRYHLNACNLALHPIEWADQAAPKTTDGSLVFMNFAGLAGDRGKNSPTQDRFAIVEGDAVQRLIARHSERVATAHRPAIEAIPYSFRCYTDGTPIAPVDRQVFSRLAPPNRRGILNPFTERCFFEAVASQSPATRRPELGAAMIRLEDLERRLNTLPYSLFAHAATAMEMALPGSRDRVYNLMQHVSRVYGSALGQKLASLRQRVRVRA